MTIFRIFLTYLFYSSTVLIYGVGLKKVIFPSLTYKYNFAKIIIFLIKVLSSALLTYFFSVKVFIPLNLLELYPIICVFLCLLIDILVNFILKKQLTIDFQDFSIIFLFSILSVNESNTFLNCIFIVIFSSISYFILLILVKAINQRLKYSHPLEYFKNGSLVFISIAIIICAVYYAWDISWLKLVL